MITPENHTVLADFAAFSQQDVESVVRQIENFQVTNADEFNEKKTRQDFYATSKNYIYDLLGANHSHDAVLSKLNRFVPNFLELIKQHPGPRFLEFGGGTGVLVEIIESKTDKRVTYVDIDGYISEFARWRLQKNNCQIETVIIPQDDFDLPKLYDVIFTDAVIEHLPDEQQLRYAQKLGSSLSDDGMLIFLVDLSGKDEKMPMHFDVNIQALHQILQKTGLTCYYGKNQFASVWCKGHLPHVLKYFPQTLLQKLRHKFL